MIWRPGSFVWTCGNNGNMVNIGDATTTPTVVQVGGASLTRTVSDETFSTRRTRVGVRTAATANSTGCLRSAGSGNQRLLGTLDLLHMRFACPVTVAQQRLFVGLASFPASPWPSGDPSTPGVGPSNKLGVILDAADATFSAFGAGISSANGTKIVSEAPRPIGVGATGDNDVFDLYLRRLAPQNFELSLIRVNSDRPGQLCEVNLSSALLPPDSALVNPVFAIDCGPLGGAPEMDFYGATFEVTFP